MEPINEADLSWTTTERGETEFRRKKLAAAADEEQDGETGGVGPSLGCSLYELPPGKRSWPYHYHTGNAEAMYVLTGSGLLRADEDEYELRAGDYVSCPAGPEGAHRVVNDGDETLRYLAMSTMRDPDVTVYPDSDKVGVFAGAPPGGEGDRDVAGYFERDGDVRYWEGED
jgi:uncharacterized cupin superfamily protein